ncbi:MAG TPA: hypothetical protein EYP36_01970, partial [Calditrichaeota bacterium]|nr:hypothetical protein [Calditrichota bacterium]
GDKLFGSVTGKDIAEAITEEHGVKIERDGIVGYGEAAPNVRYGENAKLTTQKINSARSIFKENEFFSFYKY